MITTGGSLRIRPPVPRGRRRCWGSRASRPAGAADKLRAWSGTGPEAGGADRPRPPQGRLGAVADRPGRVRGLYDDLAVPVLPARPRAPGIWASSPSTSGSWRHLRAPIVNIRGAGFNLLGDHFQPIVALIAPFFLALPQRGHAARGAGPAHRGLGHPGEPCGRRHGWAPGRGRLIGAAYGFSWGLQQMIDFDFHEIAFAVPLLACSLSALVRGKIRAAAVWALPWCSSRRTRASRSRPSASSS